jgi:hypothetical protein
MYKKLLNCDNFLFTSALEVENFCQNKVCQQGLMFGDTLEFKQIILLCYERQKTLTSQLRVLKPQVWAIVEAIIRCLNLVVIACVMK